MKQDLTQCPAELINYGITETQAGDPQVSLTFQVEGEGRLTYFGSLKEKALEYTLGALLALGYRGRDCTDLLDGPDGGALAIGTKCSVAVADNEYNGKVTRKIMFVNSLGSGLRRADPTTAKAALLASGAAGVLASLRSDRPKAPAAKPGGSDDDIEF